MYFEKSAISGIEIKIYPIISAVVRNFKTDMIPNSTKKHCSSGPTYVTVPQSLYDCIN